MLGEKMCTTNLRGLSHSLQYAFLPSSLVRWQQRKEITGMKINRESSRLLKPSYQTPSHPPTDVLIPLSPFDAVTFQTHVSFSYAYRPPNPSNEVIEQGLRRLLAEYREFAGRLILDDSNHQCILLNDEGMRFIEATSDVPLGSSMDEPSPYYRDLHPHTKGIEELAQVQLTRFACDSLVVGVTFHHAVSDGLSIGHFLVAWGQTVRNGLPILPLPLHDRSIFVPRNPPHFQFEHCGYEYTAPHQKAKNPEPGHGPIVMKKIHFSSDFIEKLKSKASADNPTSKAYTTFECLTAHLWRNITGARNLHGEVTTTVKIPVNGRFRMRNPPVPMRYLGNVVLWAWPKSKVKDLLSKPVGHATRLIQDAIAQVDDGYFRSFIDFSSSKEKMEGLVKSICDEIEAVLCPNLEVSSWLKFPIFDLDFGTGPPHLFVPSYLEEEGFLRILPSFSSIGDVDAFVGLFEKNIESFMKRLYSVDEIGIL